MIGVEIQKNSRLWFDDDYMVSRLYGPAVDNCVGSYTWYKNGKIHREDGPAILYSDGWITEFYLNDVRYDKEEYEIIIKLMEIEK